ncbi:helix-turn-helix transcriptional regulator [Pontibacillus sp. ALD_SL1]|uniref:winged helix-turn-helix transcriptional regulator n=1 Tax=Pontibacillus sp. ALD_SL1 TaxID=2777185 RepID=UPI001A95D121|nr:helix-turn-helix domain-containing protein [Pontibacillus sp. ALD_SL1]QST01335.1 helix-turn-helix transcriptional regulator [Pontibacillus sp. ALD_SL1]
MEDSSLCPKFEKAVGIISQRWNALIIYQLLSGPQRNHEIKDAIGISGRLLSERLKDLEAEDIIHREVYAETPVRIEYSLTDKGHSLKPLMKDIKAWADEWIDNPTHKRC